MVHCTQYRYTIPKKAHRQGFGEALDTSVSFLSHGMFCTRAAMRSKGGLTRLLISAVFTWTRKPLLIIVRRAGLLWSQQDFEWRWSVPLFKCLTVLEFSFILFDLCLLITFFNFIMNYVPIVTFWIFTYHKIWILSIMFCFIWSYWIIYFFSMFGSVLESCELTGVCLLLPWLIKWK